MTITTTEFCRLIEIGVMADTGTITGKMAGQQISVLVGDIAHRNDEEFRSMLVMEKKKQKE